MEGIKIIKPNGHLPKVTAASENVLPQQRHTEDMQEIITKVPSWILRWGITLFFMILLTAVGISVLVRYPDLVKANLKIETTTPAQPVITANAGLLTKVLVTSGQLVKAGQLLAYIGNTALIAQQDGKVGFIAIVQPGALVKAGQEIFTIHPANEHFYGLMEIPQTGINKIKPGQQVLINIKNYPVEDYGQLKGTITYIADEPGASGLFAVKVNFNTSTLKKSIPLKSWMAADASIITENVSLQTRLLKSIFKGLN